MGFLSDCVDNDRLQCRGSHLRKMRAANLAATLDQGHDSIVLWWSLIVAVLGFATGESLIGFDELPSAICKDKINRAVGLYLATAGTAAPRPGSGSFRGSLTRNQAT